MSRLLNNINNSSEPELCILVAETPQVKSNAMQRDPIDLLSSDSGLCTTLQPATPNETDPKLQRLLQVFSYKKSPQVLLNALKAANGNVHDAISIAALDSDPVEIENISPEIKKRKLVKKKDIPIIHLDSEKELDQFMSNTPKKFKVSTSPNTSPPIIITKSKNRNSTRQIQEDSEEEEEEVELISDFESDNFELADTSSVEYFNTCTLEGMINDTGCSEEQANLIIGLRPFQNYSHLQESLSQGKKKLKSVLERYQDVMEGYQQVDQLINQCKECGDELNAVLHDWGCVNSNGETSLLDLPVSHDSNNSDKGITHLEKQPEFINSNFTLKSYQLMGISWLNLLFSKGFGGILADEMGLGKTAQVITFLGHLASQGIKGPHLVVVPTSTLENWLREFEKWCPMLECRSYYGQLSERYEQQEEILSNLSDIHVIVTTYNMATGNKEDRSFLRKLGCISLILDEGHMIKNMESLRYKHLSNFKASFRLLMTGTPLQNNLMELLALLTFVMPDLFSSGLDAFGKIFNIKRSGEQSLLCQSRIERAKEIMTPFVLRRRKDQVLQELPKKIITIQKCQPTSNQLQMYQDILKESKKNYLAATKTEKLSKAEKKKAIAGANQQLSNTLMQLRKVSNHPLLVRQLYTNEKLKLMARQIMREPEYYDANQDYIYEDMSFMSDFELYQLCKKFKSLHNFALSDNEWMNAGKVNELSSLLPDMKQRGDRVLIFSQFVIMLDILEKVMETLGIKYVRLDGSTHINQRQILIDEFNTDPSITVFLISTKAGGVGINLTAANVVIIYDMDYNPHNDAQAEDRAHRVGQTRDVNVIKFVLSGTVEDHIYACASTKIKLDKKMRGELDESPSQLDSKIEVEEEQEQVDENVLDFLRNEMNS